MYVRVVDLHLPTCVNPTPPRPIPFRALSPGAKFIRPIGPEPKKFFAEQTIEADDPASKLDNDPAPPVTPVPNPLNPVRKSLEPFQSKSKMPPSSTMGPAAAPLRRTVLGTTAVQFPRHFSMPSKGRMVREMEKQARQGAKKTDLETMSSIQKRANDEYFKSGGGPLFPGTFIPVPFSRYPTSPNDFLRYSWFRLRQWGIETLSVLNFKLKSMPDWTTRPKWKAARGRIGPTAKVMYTDMLTAFAAGDKAAINALCLGQFAKKLTSAIDRRNPQERTVFELMSFNKALFYPRVVAHQVHNINPHDKDNSTEQAVVAISSTQRASKYSKTTGELIPGSTKVQQKVEHVVLSRQINEKTYQATPWRIWGTVPATTLESYQEEQDWINREQAKRAGWTGPESK